MMIVFGLVIPFILRFGFLAFVQFRLTKDMLFQKFRQLHKASTFGLVMSSFAIDLRLFKLIYTNAMDRLDLSTLRELDIRPGWRYPKRLYMILSLINVPIDFIIALIAITVLGSPEADARLIKVAVERILIAIMLMSITILEYYFPHRDCCKRKKTITVAPTKAIPVSAYLMLSASVTSEVVE